MLFTRSFDHVEYHKSTTAVRSADCAAGDHRFVLEAESEAPAPQPGDVHRVRRQHADDGPWHLRLGESGTRNRPAFIFGVSAWLWFTVLFANFAEAMAEGRGKAQADSLRATRRDVQAKKLDAPHCGANRQLVSAATLRKDDVVLVEAGDMIPSDGEVVEGVASVDESAITGESAPVIRESGGDRSSVTGGTRVLSDWIVVRVSANPGETFLDRMIGLVEGAKRQKTPNEIALDILLAAMTIIFLFVCATLLPFSKYSVAAAGQGSPITVTVLVALLGVPDSDDDRRPALGDRHRRHGPHDSGERDRHVGPRGGSGRRRRRAAAR